MKVPIWLDRAGSGSVAYCIFAFHKKKKGVGQFMEYIINAMAHEMKHWQRWIKNSAECLSRMEFTIRCRAEYISMIQKEADHMNKL